MHPSSSLKSFTASCASHITPLEAHLMERFCRLHRSRLLTALFTGASRLGDWPLWAGLGLTLILFGDSPGRLAVLAGAIAVALSVALFMALKNRIGRPRPFEVWDRVPCLLAPPDKFSFPSGHTMTAFAVYGAIATLLPGMGLFLLPAAVLIAISRVFLGVHYPSDVLAGALLGMTIGCGVSEGILMFLG